jgi:hypothetical protein
MRLSGASRKARHFRTFSPGRAGNMPGAIESPPKNPVGAEEIVQTLRRDAVTPIGERCAMAL